MKKGQTYNVVATTDDTGDERSVRFTVEEGLGFAYDKEKEGPRAKRWNEVELVQTVKGGYVLRRSTRSLVKGEQEEDEHDVYRNLRAAVEALDPTHALDRLILESLGQLSAVSVEV